MCVLPAAQNISQALKNLIMNGSRALEFGFRKVDPEWLTALEDVPVVLKTYDSVGCA